jgi:hypothetical protein
MEFASDVAWIIVCCVCCPTSAKNMDEYYLAWVSEFQPIHIYHSRSDRIKFQKKFPVMAAEQGIHLTYEILRHFQAFF